MAIGDTVQAGLMRIDSSPILLAGQAQAKANQAFGNALGQAATAYFEGKEKKRQKNALKEYLMRNGANEEDANAMTKSPQALEMFNQKLARDQQMQIAKMQARTSIANSKRGAMSRNADLEFQREKFEAGQELLEEQKALNESLAKFSMQPVKTPTPEFSALQQEYRPEQIPGTPEFIAMQEEPIPERPSIIAKYITEKPDFKRFEKQDSLAVAQLPDSFKPQGRRIQDAVESGELSNQAGIEAINKIYGQAIAQQKDAPSAKDILDMQAKIQDIKIKSSDYGDSESIKTFTPNSNYLQLGTTKMPITGRLGNETEAIKYKDEYIPNFNTTNETFEELLALGQKRADGWYMESQEKDQAMSFVRQLQGLIREDILGPGTVQESERVILDNIVKNPTAWSVNGAEENMKILKNLRQKIFNRLENRLTNFGLNLGDSRSPNSPKSKPEYTEETSRGNKIRTFDFDNLNQEI
jgi:hypothetical protein